MKVIKYLLLFFIFILFGLHVIQQRFHVFHQESLIGVADSTKRPALTKGSYYHRKFQPVFQKYVEEKMGFRPHLLNFGTSLITLSSITQKLPA